MKHILVTGATGKVGRNFIGGILQSKEHQDTKIRALCHNRLFEPQGRVEVVRGNISVRPVVQRALQGITHVVHCATCKETPEDAMDVSVKGLFWLLEECRISPTFQQFILIGGDCSVGHFFYPHGAPVTEQQKHTAYPGCYALSKVLEEVMLEQYYIQYDLNGCCLRAPWIMEKDDFRFTLSFGEDVFGGPRWRDLVNVADADLYQRNSTVPLMLDRNGMSIKRNFVHVTDLVSAMLRALDHPKARQQTFNIAMNEPVDYSQVADYLRKTRNLASIEIRTPYFSTLLDNTKAKLLLEWEPRFDLLRLIEEAWNYQRSPNDPRTIWYPG